MEDARAQQGGLATPRGADECKEPSPDEVADRLGDDLFPAEEELRVVRLEPCEPFVRTHVGRADRFCIRRPVFEPGVVREDRRLEPLQLGARFDPELIDQHRAGTREGLERLGLTTGAVEREHELAPAPLAERLLSNHGLKVGDQLIRVPASELGFDQVFARSPSDLVEPLAFGSSEARIPIALIGSTSPEPERLS